VLVISGHSVCGENGLYVELFQHGTRVR